MENKKSVLDEKILVFTISDKITTMIDLDIDDLFRNFKNELKELSGSDLEGCEFVFEVKYMTGKEFNELDEFNGF